MSSNNLPDSSQFYETIENMILKKNSKPKMPSLETKILQIAQQQACFKNYDI